MQTNQTRTLLVIAGEFPPLKTIGRIRTVKFVKHLQDHGWKAIVVTLEPSGQEPNYDPGLLAEIAEGVEVIRLPLVDLEAKIAQTAKRLLGRNSSAAQAPSATKSAQRRPISIASPSLLDRAHGAVRWFLKNFVYIPDNYASWAKVATKECLRICGERKIDAIYTTLPPFSSVSVGHDLRRQTSLPWVVDYRDLWYGDVLREWLPEWRKRLELRIEKRLLRGRRPDRYRIRTQNRLHAASPPSCNRRAGKPSPMATTSNSTTRVSARGPSARIILNSSTPVVSSRIAAVMPSPKPWDAFTRPIRPWPKM